MKKLIVILSLFNFIGSTSYAEESIYLNQGQTAPYSGFLLPKEKVQELYNNTTERDFYKNTNDSLKKSIDLEQSNNNIKDQKIKLLLDQNDQLAKTAYNARELSNWEKIGYFLGGIIVTSLAIKGMHELYR